MDTEHLDISARCGGMMVDDAYFGIEDGAVMPMDAARHIDIFRIHKESLVEYTDSLQSLSAGTTLRDRVS